MSCRKKYKCLCKNSNCDKEGLPGSVGIFSDKTVQFLSNPSTFVEAQCETLGSRVFTCRLATKQTIVIADYRTLKLFLNSSQKHFRTGLNDFSELFGDCIMFAEEDAAISLKKILLPLFNPQSVSKYEPVLQNELDTWSSNVDPDMNMNLYEEFKNITLAYNVNIFMGVNKSENINLFNSIKELASTHWHGFVSLPTNYSVPLFGQGGYKKAMDAKQKLMAIIKSELESSNSSFFEHLKNNQNDVMTEEVLYNHMLLFSCALIPKAVGSVLVMFFELMDKWKHLLGEDGTLTDANLHNVLLEVMRLYPPFIGNLKIAKDDSEVGDFCCPAGTAVFYSWMGAMRDPTMFLYPDEFMPNRWQQDADGDNALDQHLAWGGGLHSCVGRLMSWSTLLTISRHVLERFHVTRGSGEVFSDVKHLPVVRPSNPAHWRLKRK